MSKKITIRLPDNYIKFIEIMKSKYNKPKTTDIIKMSLNGWIQDENMSYIFTEK